ncbi:ethylene-responsive transcription factor ERF016-like [Cornus florida]|uniref:ethylene-responsive transcription factor ERF016-like n=1 Tax=Cornus florida TaxID=4283 RepID=UPI0028A1B2C1|nr:ethylene-responsive transcription factor ERF016-like [Cornus florida]
MVRISGREERRDGVSNVRYKGVRMRKWGKWVAEVRQPNSRRRIWLGSYQTPEEAARAYDAAVFCLRGQSAALNFPECPPDIPSAAELSPSQIQAVASRHARRIPMAEDSNTIMKESNPAVMESDIFGETSESYGGSVFGEFSASEFYYDPRIGGEGGNGNFHDEALYGMTRVWTS